MNTAGLRDDVIRVASAARGRCVEMDVLLCVGRRSLSLAGQQRLRNLLSAGVDWERLQRFASRHKLLPLLYWHLREVSDAVPASVLDRLEQSFLDNARRMLTLTAELVGIVEALAARQVPAVPYKGPALGVEAYGNLSLRRAADLDIVVRRRDLPCVRELLRSRGYRPEHDLPAAGEPLMERGLYHEAFYLQGACTVEVHWGFTDKQIGFTLDLDMLEPRLRTVGVAGHEFHSFAREDLLLILCVHGAKHRWDQLELLVALAELLRAGAPLDWPVVLNRAAHYGSRRALLLGLRLASKLLGAPLPTTVRRAVFEDQVVGELATTVECLLFADPHAARSVRVAPHDVFYMALNERAGDKLRYLFHRLTTPSQARSWRGVRIGRRYLPLHAVTRPFASWRRLWPAARWYLTSDRGP